MGVRWSFLGIWRVFITKGRLLLENFTMSLSLIFFLKKKNFWGYYQNIYFSRLNIPLTMMCKCRFSLNYFSPLWKLISSELIITSQALLVKYIIVYVLFGDLRSIQKGCQEPQRSLILNQPIIMATLLPC